MSPAQSNPASGQAGRRAACDRCRAQKLRCIREDNGGISAKCKRCAAAKTTCSFGMPKPPGRPSAARQLSTADGAQGDNDATQNQPATTSQEAPGVSSSSRSGGSDFPPLLLDQQLGAYPGDATLTFTADEEGGGDNPRGQRTSIAAGSSIARHNEDHHISSWSNIWLGGPVPPPHPATSDLPSHRLHLHEGSLASVSDGTDFMNLDAIGPSISWDWSVDHARHTSRPWAPLPSTISSSQSRSDTPVNPIDYHGAIPDIGGNGSHLSSAVSRHGKDPNGATAGGGFIQTVPQDPTRATTHGQQDGMMDCLPMPSRRSRGNKPRCSISSLTAQHHRMQRLSELRKSVYRLFSAGSDLQQEIEAVGKLSYFPEEFTGKLLDSSTVFLELLRSFRRSSMHSSEPPTETRSSTTNESVNTTPPSDFSDFSSDETFPGVRPTQRPHRYNKTANGTADSVRDAARRHPLQADKATVLELLACYLRFRQLHSILYLSIHRYLTHMLQGDHQSRSSAAAMGNNSNTVSLNSFGQCPPIFSGMQIGGVSLEGFGNFQIKLVLQISTHMLGAIERALGLPDNYRVSRRRDDEEYSILDGFSPECIKLAMANYAFTGEPEADQDGVFAIKDQLVKLRGLLKGSINM